MAVVVDEMTLALVIGAIILFLFLAFYMFSTSLKAKSYDEALREIQSQERGRPKSPKKNKKKSVMMKDEIREDAVSDPTEEEPEDESPPPTIRQRRGSKAKPRRADSVKEHVMFADEISADDERHNPPTEEEAIESILHNRDEVQDPPEDIPEDTPILNKFEEIHPLDDWGLEFRRKSLQLTPSGSLPSSNKGSNTNLAKLNDELEAEEDASPTRRSKLKFDSDVVVRDAIDDVIDDDDNVNTKRLCTVIKKASMTNDEITQVIECLLKKEEQNNWVGEKNKPSVVSQMKQELEEIRGELSREKETVSSLQAKLKSTRGEVTHAQSDKKELEKTVAQLQDEVTKLGDSIASISKENASLKENLNTREAAEAALVSDASKDDLNDSLRKDNESLKAELAALKVELDNERKENEMSNQSVKEQQGIMRAALCRLFPNIQVEEYCPEHQKWFDEFVAKIRQQQENGEVKEGDAKIAEAEETVS